MAYRKHELVVALKSKGWRGDESRLTKEQVERMVAERGIDAGELARIIRAFKSGNLGGGGEQRPAQQGMTQAEVVALIDAAFNKGGAGADEETTRQWIAEAVAKAQPEKIIIDTAASVKQQMAIVTGVHPLFKKVLKLVTAGINVLLVGPAGCGKTTMAHHIAKALKRKFGMLSCTSGASESQLTGWLLPVEAGGKFAYVPSEFVDLYEEGDSVFLFDEFDAADPNMLVVNSALANGSLHVPQRFKKPHVARGERVAMIAAANTFGSGADMVYAGRNQLDAATLDRFYVIEMDYDRDLEKRLGDEAVVAWAWRLREQVRQHGIKRVVSTRTIMKMTAAIRAGACDFAEAKRDALAGWRKDEMAKVNA
jgi:cobaltochelatase CobS